MSRPRARRLLALVVLLTAFGAASSSPAPATTATPPTRLANVRVEGGQQAWRAVGQFRVLWDLVPAPTGESTSAWVSYELYGPEGSPLAGGEIKAGAPGLLVDVPAGANGAPVPGEYRLSLRLEPSSAATDAATVRLRLDNDRPPPARPLVPSGWIKAGASVEVRIEHPGWPRPLSGIRGYAVELDQGAGGEPCAHPVCAEDEIDLGGGEDDDSVVLGPLAEGRNVVRVAAVSGSGMPSAVIGAAALHVDGTPPAIAIGTPAGWSRQALTATATATDLLSGTAAAGPSGPLTAIAVDGGPPSVAPGDRAAVAVHGDGAHVLTAFARDAVGNLGAADPRTAHRTVWIDETAPRLAFADPDPATPERVVAVVDDPLSGPSARRGSIAIRPAGMGLPFEPLPTRIAGNRLVADWDSDAYPRGDYEFRAVGFDVAGNRSETTRRADGAQMLLSNPVKTPTSLAFGFGGRRFVAHRCRRRHHGLRCHRQTITSFSRRPPVTRAAYRRRVPVSGRLTDASGAPVAGLPVAITETFAAGSESASRTTTAITGDDGFFLARLARGPSRRIAVAFAGTGHLTAARGRELGLSVRSAVHLRASSTSARVGGAPVVFRGHLGRRGAALGDEGVRVALEFRVAGLPWTEFRTVQTDPYGAFRLAYAFSDDDSRGVRFLFRAHVAGQPGWPYAPGYSLPIAVTGR